MDRRLAPILSSSLAAAASPCKIIRGEANFEIEDWSRVRIVGGGCDGSNSLAGALHRSS